VGAELAYQAWYEREVAAGRDPDERSAAFLDEEPPVRDAPVRDAPDRDAPVRCDLSDDDLVERVLASRRRVNREHYEQVLDLAEFGRRRERAFAAAAARGVPTGVRPGGFPGEELAVELVVTRAEAGHLLADAADLTARLPRTLAAVAAGLIDQERAGIIAFYSRSLSPADTALADEILSAAAPDLRAEQLARKAAALEMKLNPEGVRARREQARRDRARVEARREASGNASLAAREMGTAAALASEAHIYAVAARLRAAGLAGSLGELRVLAFGDLTTGRDPFARLTATPAEDPADTSGPVPSGDCGGSGPQAPGPAPAPLPALVNLLVPVGALLGWSTTPAHASRWGLLDPDDTRTVAAAAAASPRTRWCVTLVNPDGTAAAHGCATGSRPRLLNDLEPQPPPRQLAELLRRLNVIFTPVAAGNRDHDPAEEHYRPSRHLRHLVRARTAACDAPGCDSPALSGDLDHTVPWPTGPTSQDNLAPRCRTHHRAKQAPDWKVEQLADGSTRWTMPSGRVHTTHPTRYDL
jgi:hypothetical protein